MTSILDSIDLTRLFSGMTVEAASRISKEYGFNTVSVVSADTMRADYIHDRLNFVVKGDIITEAYSG